MRIIRSAVFLLFPLALIANEGEPAKPEASTSGKLPAWVDLQNKIAGIEARIKTKQNNINKLIQEKNKLPPGSPKSKAIVDEMIKEHTSLRRLFKDYESNNAKLKFRYPEKGAQAVRTYEKIEIKSLQQMETELDVDGRLQRNLKTMRSQYSGPKERTTTTLVPVQLAPQEKPIEESDVIIIQK